MKQLDTTTLRRSITFLIAISMLLLIIVTTTLTSILQKHRQNKREQEYSTRLHQSIEHAIKHNIRDFTYRARRIVETTNLASLLQNRDREGLYALLKPNWDLMVEENKFLKIMQIHLKDGSSFLRVHKPESFGDDIATVRPMLKEIHQAHKLIVGYETGRFSTVYRVIVPIFTKNREYLGAFEIGINPNFIVSAARDKSYICGAIFIKEDDLKLFKREGDIVIDGYQLQSDITPKLRMICNMALPIKGLSNHLHTTVDGKEYRSHLFVLNDFQGQPRVKIIFFQDLSEVGLFRDYLLATLLAVMALTLSFLMWFIYRRIDLYQENITKIYKDQIKKLNKSEKKLIENEKVYFDFFEHTKSANIMYSSDDNGKTFKIKALNKLVESLENVKRENIIGRRVDEVFEGIEAFGLLDIFKEVYQSGKAQKMPITLYEDGSLKGWRENYIFKLSSGDIVASYEDRTKEKELDLLLKNTINSVENLIFVKDSEFKYLECNGAFEKFIGHTRDELIGKDDYDFFDKELADIFRSKDSEIFNTQQRTESLEWTDFSDGSRVYLYTMLSPLRDSLGTVIGLVGNAVDLTHQKRLEDELQASKQQFEQFMEFIPANILIKDDGIIVYANSSAEASFNVENILGKTAQDLLLDDIAKKVDVFEEKALREGTHEEILEIFNDKNEKKIYRNMTFSMEGKKKKRLGIVSIDITKQYQDQHDIIKFKEIIEKSPISIVVTDIDGNLEYVNSWFTQVTGYTYDEVMGKNPRILKSDYHTGEDYKELWDEITHNHVWAGTFKNIKKSGEEYWESAIIAPLKDSKGVISNFIGIKQEITQEVYLKRELKDKEEIMIAQSRHAAMGEMIGMIAHQWRQPISVIAMGANNMIVDIELEDIQAESFKQQAESILYQTEYLSKTIDDFRNFFRPDKEIEEIRLEDIMQEANKIIGSSLQNNNIKFTIEHENGLKVKTYSRELLQVYINLLKNAKEAIMENSSENGHINVLVSDDKESVITTICDNGGGIDTAIMDSIFDPYFSTKDEKTGTGLGLYMSKTIIEKHLKGTIEVYNTQDGVCFKIAIPIDIGGGGK